MAQTGYTPILIYSSSTVSQAPAVGNLTNSTLGSELAINITDGKLFYKDNANAIQVIAWKTTPTTAGGTGLTSYTAGDMLYYASGTTLTKLAIGTSGQWLGSSGTAPQWNAPAALTKTDDTNVTLTLGGNASTALLNAASLTLGWTGTLATTRGGTGLSSFTANGVLYASSTSALTTGSAFTYNGTTLSLNSAAAAIGIGATGDTTYHFFRTIDNAGQSIYIGNDDAAGSFFSAGAYNRVIYSEGARSLKVFVNGAYRAEYDTSGNYKLDTGNLIQGTAAKGINFTANTNAPGMTSELLNWYEEGTWTPEYTNATPPTTPYTMTVASATYTRIGRQVTVRAWIYTQNVNTAGAVGALQISGLPFTSAASSAGYSAMAIGQARGWVTAPSYGYVDGTSIILMYRTAADADDQTLTAAGLTTGAVANKNQLMFTATYFV